MKFFASRALVTLFIMKGSSFRAISPNSTVSLPLSSLVLSWVSILKFAKALALTLSVISLSETVILILCSGACFLRSLLFMVVTNGVGSFSWYFATTVSYSFSAPLS